MTEQNRRRIEQPTEAQAKRSGCLLWGGVLGVLVGVMVGIYALPPILKHYYGETVIESGEEYVSSGLRMRLLEVTVFDEVLASPERGLRRVEALATFEITAERKHDFRLRQFTLEVQGLEDWQHPPEDFDIASGALDFDSGERRTVDIPFAIDYDPAKAPPGMPEAVHLSDPRVKFKVARE